MKIKFLGAAGTVTGSKTLVSFKDKNILLDYGQYQGDAELEKLNHLSLEKMGVLKNEMPEVVLIGHGHLDHCGLLPMLYEKNVHLRSYMTPPTLELAQLLWQDSLSIMKSDKKKHDLKPLFNFENVNRASKMATPIEWGSEFSPCDGVLASFLPNSHILGASSIWLKSGNSTLLYSGDLGRRSERYLKGPQAPFPDSDYLILESTYGNRVHPEITLTEQILSHVKYIKGHGGQLFIPSFAIDRMQEILMALLQLKKEHKLKSIPVYIDSPMGHKATLIYQKYHTLLAPKEEAWDEILRTFHWILHQSQREKLMNLEEPHILLSSSGMLEGGRAMSYLPKYLPNPRATILLCGYQAEGTLGRKLHEGIKTVELELDTLKVEAQIHKLEGASAHADSNELINWIDSMKNPPKKIFLIHGEDEARMELSMKLKQKYNCEVHIPKASEEFFLNP